MNMRCVVGASLLTLAAVSSARANLLINGGLELPPNTPLNQYNFITLAPGSSTLTGWSITKGTVDVVPGAATGNPYWENTEGSFSVDLVGTPGIGGISQRVDTVKGTTYTLTFDLAVNPEEGPFLEHTSSKIMRVDAIAGDGTTIVESQLFSNLLAGLETDDAMAYSQQTFTFTATGAHTTIRLQALKPLLLASGATSSNIFTGPVIDNLDLEPGGGSQIPEPASLGLLGTGATALLLRRRRKAA